MTYKTLTKMNDGDYPVELQTNANGNKYRVIYGKQVKDFAEWYGAAKEYGDCVFHSLECAGLVDRGN